MASMDETRRFDIVRKENERAMFWLESVADLTSAKRRVEALLSFWPGDYQVFDLETKQVVLDTAQFIVDGTKPEVPVAQEL